MNSLSHSQSEGVLDGTMKKNLAYLALGVGIGAGALYAQRKMNTKQSSRNKQSHKHFKNTLES